MSDETVRAYDEMQEQARGMLHASFPDFRADRPLDLDVLIRAAVFLARAEVERDTHDPLTDEKWRDVARNVSKEVIYQSLVETEYTEGAGDE